MSTKTIGGQKSVWTIGEVKSEKTICRQKSRRKMQASDTENITLIGSYGWTPSHMPAV